MSAVISKCGQYRYQLERRFQNGHRFLLWIMCNPSTATGELDDPTVRQCAAFTKLWGAWGNTWSGYDGFWIGNAYAYRATDPRELSCVADPVGPENDAYLYEMATAAAEIVVAWGNHVKLARVRQVLEILRGHDLFCFGTTKTGAPRHPLRVAHRTEPSMWRAAGDQP